MEQQINLDLKQTSEVVCDSCGSNVFVDGVMLRKVSKFLTGSGKDSYVPVSVFYCTKCGHVNDEFLPPVLLEMRKEAGKLSSTPPAAPVEEKKRGKLTIV